MGQIPFIFIHRSDSPQAHSSNSSHEGKSSPSVQKSPEFFYENIVFSNLINYYFLNARRCPTMSETKSETILTRGR
jgi:hypothetical protein